MFIERRSGHMSATCVICAFAFLLWVKKSSHRLTSCCSVYAFLTVLLPSIQYGRSFPPSVPALSPLPFPSKGHGPQDSHDLFLERDYVDVGSIISIFNYTPAFEQLIILTE